MGLVLKHVERTSSGSFQYRRRVPKDVATVIPKAMFKKKLGDSEKEALAAFPRFHAQVEREIQVARQRLTLSAEATSPSASDLAAYAEALRRRADLVASGATTEELEAVGDAIAESYPQDDWQPVGAAPVDRHTINLMRLGPKKYPAPAATLMDARRLYLAERAKGGDSPEALERFSQQVSRVVGHVRNALGCDPVLVDLTRDDARTVRDYMLDRIMGNGKKINPASVARDLNGLKAVINFAAVELPFRPPFKTRSTNSRWAAKEGGPPTERSATHSRLKSLSTCGSGFSEMRSVISP